MKSSISTVVLVLFNSAGQEMAWSVFNCVDSMLSLAAEILHHFSIRSVLLEIKAQTWFRGGGEGQTWLTEGGGVGGETVRELREAKSNTY